MFDSQSHPLGNMCDNGMAAAKSGNAAITDASTATAESESTAAMPASWPNWTVTEYEGFKMI